MANEEVAHSKVSIEHCQAVLKLLHALREGDLVAHHLAVHLVKDARGCWHHVALNVVNPRVDLGT